MPKTSRYLACRVKRMTSGRLEILVEPFKENDPGPHVTAVLDTLTAAGFAVDMGPFSTTVDGPVDELVGVLQAVLKAGFDAGATSIQARVERR